MLPSANDIYTFNDPGGGQNIGARKQNLPDQYARPAGVDQRHFIICNQKFNVCVCLGGWVSEPSRMNCCHFCWRKKLPLSDIFVRLSYKY